MSLTILNARAVIFSFPLVNITIVLATDHATSAYYNSAGTVKSVFTDRFCQHGQQDTFGFRGFTNDSQPDTVQLSAMQRTSQLPVIDCR